MRIRLLDEHTNKLTDKALAAIHEELGPVAAIGDQDVLVNCAGVGNLGAQFNRLARRLHVGPVHFQRLEPGTLSRVDGTDYEFDGSTWNPVHSEEGASQ